MPKRVMVVVAALLAACGCKQPAGATEPPQGGDDVAALIDRAQRELEVAATLDYRAPFEDVRREAQYRGMALLFDACKRGDARSCWRAIELPDTHSLVDIHAMALVIARKCLAGDKTSCRALRSQTVRENALGYDGGAAETDALCDQGLGAACWAAGYRVRAGAAQRMWYGKGCDAGDAWSCEDAAELDAAAGKPADEVDALVLRASERAAFECERGIARSCYLLVKIHGGDMARVERAGRDACALGLMDECNLLTRNDITEALRLPAMDAICRQQGWGCNILAGALTDPLAVRDALEHGCQLSDSTECLELARRYRVQDFPEPVPGRGRALAEHVCRKRDVPEACDLAVK